MSVQPTENYQFETGVYRPPSEGGSFSLLVRFTRNCPWNRCGFCAMYKTEKFQLRPVPEIKADIDAIAALCNALTDSDGRVCQDAAVRLISRRPALNNHPGFAMVYHWLHAGGKTAFVQDANSMIMPTDALVEALGHLRHTFASIVRVTSYARSKTIAQKSPDELVAIHQAGLDRLHVGLESGDADLLKHIKKGVTPENHIKGGQMAMAAGFQLSEYWMPGLGGRQMWEQHARNTALVLNQINPHFIRSRPLNTVPGTPLCDDEAAGRLTMLTAHEQLRELKLMIQTLEVTSRVCFDHAANYWTDRRGNLLFTHSYEGYKFPEEKPKVLERIEQGLLTDNHRPSRLLL
ncbi:MAG: radical SAM protein [Desulfatitalea sp.]|nr:radical SAM protein [Desulfatitalea sp.]NNK01674.1 radical SAM protein [Desulfatitalea sp.]